MRRLLTASVTVLALAAALTGCSKKTETATTETSSDSLLATNPVEQPQGNLTPQEQYQGNQNAQQTPVPTPQPVRRQPRTSTTHTTHTTTTTTNTTTEPRGVTLAAGTPIEVTVSSAISSETANVGDSWTGEVKDNIIVGNTVVVPAGSTVTGVVNTVVPAKRGDNATLDIAVRSISINGTSHAISAGTEPIVAGSTRARNLGAIAGGAAAGALIGRAVGGGKGTLIGGLIGGAAAGAGVAKSKGYQVVLKQGTVMTFTVSQAVTVNP
jgi:hypothetical protein